MKNESLKLLPLYLAGLVLMAVSTWLLTPVLDGQLWVLWILGSVLLCLAAVLCHVLSKRRRWLYITGYLINATASGLAVATLYAVMEWDVSILALLAAATPAAVLGLGLCLGYFGQGKLWRKIWGLVVLLLAVVLAVLSVIVWVKWHRVIGSFGFFSSICLLFFLMACLFTLDHPNGKWRYLSFSGFWAFAVIAVVVVVILSEGDFLDGLDFDFSGGGGGSAKKKRGK